MQFVQSFKYLVKRFTTDSLNKSTTLLIILGTSLLAIYYTYVWKDIQGFVNDIDTCDLIFCDFVNHYYPMARELFQRTDPVGGYFYSAFFAIMLTVFSHLSSNGAIGVWWIFQIVTTLLLFMLPLRRPIGLSSTQVVFYALFFFISIPIFHNLKWGQISVFLTLCIVAAFVAHQHQKFFLAAFILALATSIKYYPGIFILYFLFQKSWRTVVIFCICVFLFFIVIPIFVMGIEHWSIFQLTAFQEAADADWIERDRNSQYFVHLLNRLSDQYNLGALLQPLRFILIGINIVLVKCLVEPTWKKNFFENHQIKEALSYCLLLLTIPFFIKTSWPHYFVYLPLCQIVIIRSISTVSQEYVSQYLKLSVYSMVILSVTFSSTLYFNTFSGWKIYSAQGWIFWSNMLLLLAIYTLIVSDRFLSIPKHD